MLLPKDNESISYTSVYMVGRGFETCCTGGLVLGVSIPKGDLLDLTSQTIQAAAILQLVCLQIDHSNLSNSFLLVHWIA